METEPQRITTQVPAYRVVAMETTAIVKLAMNLAAMGAVFNTW